MTIRRACCPFTEQHERGCQHADLWQWQCFIRGTEYPARFVDDESRITLRGCYRSEGDLLLCDGIPVLDDVEAALSGLEPKHRLTRRAGV